MRKTFEFVKDVFGFVKEEWPLLVYTLVLITVKATPWVATAYIAAHFIYKYW
jgi:hypothetical protein